MFKTIQIIVMAALCLNFNSRAQSQSTLPLPKKQAILGKVISSTTGEALPGAVIKVTTPNHTTVSNDKGEFILTLSNGTYNISISHLSYKTKSITIQVPLKDSLVIALDNDDKNLQEVEIVSTGYQNIPKERATGAFTLINNKTVNRSVGINILDRLDGIASGFLLNKTISAANNSKISVRGRSTIFANAEPLIVLDGFPYDGNIDQINAADMASITILKDAAAASIWGTRASNGVIVITSKSGKINQKLAVGISSTITISNKPDLYYSPQISSVDYVDLEQFLFSKGYYDNTLSNKFSPISLVVEILNKQRSNQITVAEAERQINSIKKHDIRSDLEKYVYRAAVNQQYQLNLRGGSKNSKYYISAGYDKNLANVITDSYDRLVLNANNAYSLLKDRLEISTNFTFTSSNTKNKYDSYYPFGPYDQLADNNGNPLPVVNNLRQTYIDTAGNGMLLDWNYRPKNELTPNQIDHRIQYKINMGGSYKILDGLAISANYQYLNETGGAKRNFDLNSYYTRNMINSFSQVVGNSTKRIVPLGDIQSNDHQELISKNFRLQLNYEKKFGADHQVNAIAGYEHSNSRTSLDNQILYGLDPQTLINGNNNIDPLSYYPYYYNSDLSNRISTAPSSSRGINITHSYYTNISYSFKNRYYVSISARKDESNLFGVKSNQKGVPLWSAGVAWNINQEDFFNLDFLTSLKLRITYGYNGNLDKTVSGYLTVQSFGGSLRNPWGSSYSKITNPPNPALRWEKVRTWNFGMDYILKNNRLSGSLDVYQKNAIDLIGNNPISMQSGVTQFKGNGANLKTSGIDLIINSKNLISNFQWSTSLLFNYSTDKVTSYKIKQSSNYNIASGNYQNPLEGYSYFSIFSFPSAGLDATGAPQAYLNGVPSKSYSTVTGLLDPAQLKYHGSASPKYFGSVINTFGYRNFELSFNLIYKFDYYFRRQNVFSGSNYDYRLTDYNNRWQRPGDEAHTRIPALTYPQNNAVASFFRYSEDLVEKGDHIRLQDIRFSYQIFELLGSKSVFKTASFFFYARNLGILWRKNKVNIDPNYGSTSIPEPFNSSLGINLKL